VLCLWGAVYKKGCQRGASRLGQEGTPLSALCA
jgi:hypothetical protein